MNKAKTGYFLIFLLFICGMGELRAQEGPNYARGIWGFVGLGGGLVLIQTDEDNVTNAAVTNLKEVDKMGFTVHGRGGLSWYFSESWVFDLMAGWQYSQVSGDAEVSGDEDVKITHQTGILDISPRYRFGQTGRFQAGPLVKLHFGTDTAYEEVEGQNFDNKPLTWYVGAHLNYDIPSRSRKTLYRLGLQAMMDVNDPRAYYRIVGIFEMGFHLWGGQAAPEPVEEVVVEEPEEFIAPPVLEEDLPPEPPVVAQNFVADQVSVAEIRGKCVIRFPASRFNFDTNMSHLKESRARQYLRQLGGWLADNANIWGQALATGHTDIRGGDRINRPLSAGRARTFKMHLGEGGAESSRVSYEGRASSQPVDEYADNRRDPKAWKANRRTELEFTQADCVKINNKVKSLNQLYGF